MGTSDPGYDAGTYVDEMAELNGKLGAALGELHEAREQLAAKDAALALLRDAHHIPYVDEEHRGGNCADIVVELVAARLKAESALERERSSRQAWAAEAARLSWINEAHGSTCLSDEIHKRVCACVSDDQANHLANAGFSRPQCAVHPIEPVGERLEFFDLSLPAAELPEHLRHLANDAPRQRCGSCGRSTWSPSEFGQVCGMPQPDGFPCQGVFR